jgi:hypothetical protein
MFLFIVSVTLHTEVQIVPYLRMKLISLISVEKVDIFACMLSSVETREKRLWMMGNAAYSAGTKLPTWAMICNKAIARTYVLFPLILHPVIV